MTPRRYDEINSKRKSLVWIPRCIRRDPFVKAACGSTVVQHSNIAAQGQSSPSNHSLQYLKSFTLHLSDKTVKLHDISVTFEKRAIRLIGLRSPFNIQIEYVNPLGPCAFDDEGLIRALTKLPSFMLRYIRSDGGHIPEPVTARLSVIKPATT
jgi:hypothetical protein